MPTAAQTKANQTRAQNKAQGHMTVRQQRAAARAAKGLPPNPNNGPKANAAASGATTASAPFTPPPPRPFAPRPSRRRRRAPFVAPPPPFNAPPPPPPPNPVMPKVATWLNAPKPMTAKDARLAAMLAMEVALKASLGGAKPTVEQDEAFLKYQKCKTLALAPSINVETAREAATALRMAMVAIVKLVF